MTDPFDNIKGLSKQMENVIPDVMNEQKAFNKPVVPKIASSRKEKIPVKQGKLLERYNSNQRKILAIFVPIIILVITLGFIYNHTYYFLDFEDHFRSATCSWNTWAYSYGYWTVALISITLFEMWILKE